MVRSHGECIPHEAYRSYRLGVASSSIPCSFGAGPPSLLDRSDATLLASPSTALVASLVWGYGAMGLRHEPARPRAVGRPGVRRLCRSGFGRGEELDLCRRGVHQRNDGDSGHHRHPSHLLEVVACQRHHWLLVRPRPQAIYGKSRHLRSIVEFYLRAVLAALGGFFTPSGETTSLVDLKVRCS